MVTFCSSPESCGEGFISLLSAGTVPFPHISLPPSRNMTLLPTNQPLAWEPCRRERFGLKAFLGSGGALRSWDMAAG